jgi:hypothetical protein
VSYKYNYYLHSNTQGSGDGTWLTEVMILLGLPDPWKWDRQVVPKRW